MAELVYSTKNIRFHGGAMRNKEGKIISRTSPFELSERFIKDGKACYKSKKIIIRNGKNKIISESIIATSSPKFKEDATIKALDKLNSLFKEAKSISAKY